MAFSILSPSGVFSSVLLHFYFIFLSSMIFDAINSYNKFPAYCFICMLKTQIPPKAHSESFSLQLKLCYKVKCISETL